MARQAINLGTAPSGLDGDDARTAFTKTNANFVELYGGANASPTKLTAIANAVWAANQMPYMTSASAVAMTGLTAFARNILDDADAAAVRATLELGTSATATMTISNTDNTAGRSAKIGDFGLGSVAPPLLSDFATAIVPPGWYRGFGDGHASATPNAPPGSGNAAISIFVGSGLNASYTAYMVISNIGSTSRVFFGNRAAAGAIPVWGQSINVGDFGLGSYAARWTGAEADSASTTANGFYDIVPQTTAQWANSPFPNAWTRLMNISHNNPGGYWTQLAFNFDTNPQIKVRGMSAGVRGNWLDVLTANNGVTLDTAQDIAGTKTFTGVQLRHRAATPGLWMSPSSDSSYDDIWMVMSSNTLQWQRRANNFTSTLRSPSPMYFDLATNQIFLGYQTRPSVDGSQQLGVSNGRWSTIFATTGTINTSDAREKTPVRQLSQAEVNAAKQMSKEIGTYQWLESVKEKGEDGARHHVGMTVQRAIEILEENGLDPFSLGFVCYDEWEEQPERTQIDRVGRVYFPATDENEEVELYTDVMEEMSSTEAGTVWEWTHDVVNVIAPKVEAGNRYSFRYDELNLFIAAGIEARLAALEEAMAANA